MSILFNRMEIDFRPLAERENKLDFDLLKVDPDRCDVALSPAARRDVLQTAKEIREAKSSGSSVILAFGAHAIKNGLAPVFQVLAQKGWITHFATNGAGFIHDWEFALQGKTGEDVQHYAKKGQFGIWHETGFFLNLAIVCGAYRGFGYGRSIAALIEENGLNIPTDEELASAVQQAISPDATTDDRERGSASIALQSSIKQFHLQPGFLPLEHRFPQNSFCYAASRAGVPITCHPMFGHDIIYAHPMNSGIALGLAAQRDFLLFAASVSRLQRGVYMSVGSAVMSPMIFEKALSMARNVSRQAKSDIDDFAIHVVDLAPSAWNWNLDGEPPMDHPAYYLRFCKTFSRMGGRMTYSAADNRSWFLALLKELEG